MSLSKRMNYVVMLSRCRDVLDSVQKTLWYKEQTDPNYQLNLQNSSWGAVSRDIQYLYATVLYGQFKDLSSMNTVGLFTQLRNSLEGFKTDQSLNLDVDSIMDDLTAPFSDGDTFVD